MITTDNTYTIDMPETFAKAAQELTGIQSSIAGRKNVKKTGYLQNYLRAKPYNVVTGNKDVTLTVTYPTYIRFLDMKLGKGGKGKVSVDIYNKYVWGFLVGYVYSRTRGVIARFVADKLHGVEIEI